MLYEYWNACDPGCARFEGNGYGNVSCAVPLAIVLVNCATSLDCTPHAPDTSCPRVVSMNLPYPPRITVFPSAVARQANPMRGAKSVFCAYRSPCGSPTWLAVKIG